MVNANPVVFDGKNPAAIPFARRDMNLRLSAGAIFDSIADQILQQLLQVNGMHANDWQRIACHNGIRFIHPTGETRQHVGQDLIGVGLNGGSIDKVRSCIEEQVANEFLHPLGCRGQVFEKA